MLTVMALVVVAATVAQAIHLGSKINLSNK